MKTQILSKEQFESPANQNRDNAIIGYRQIEDDRLNMKEGSLVRIKSTSGGSRWYYRVKGFYRMNNGKEGVILEGLTAGIHESSMPIAHIGEIRFFDSLDAMQKDIYAREKKDSCRSTCDQSDWKEGGKCDQNGCYHQ